MFNAEVFTFIAILAVVIWDVAVSRHGIQGLVEGEDGGTWGSPSRLRKEKVGISGLPTDITRRLPDAGGGEGRRWRGRQGGTSRTLVAASAGEAW